MNNRYPLTLRKLNNGLILGKRVFTAEEEAALIAEGWSPKMPALPEPVPVTDDTAAAIGSLAEGLAEAIELIKALEERAALAADAWADLVARVEKLEQKRGPGRPAKETNEPR
jgi:hypothetical protein